QVQPTPVGTTHCLDAEGNNVTSVWFDGEHSEMVVTARARVETTRENPFDYLLRPSGSMLPMQYDESTARLIQPALQRVAFADEADAVATFTAPLLRDAQRQLLPFLDQLNQTIYTEFECIHREEGPAWLPTQTLGERRGACRDLADLFVDACRVAGLAARFVSGYQEGDSQQDRRDLHGWAEVYVPGGGWRGYDPTHGVAVADGHVAVAASISTQNAAPVTGSFRGTNATAVMETDIDLHTASQPQPIQQAQQQQQEMRAMR
ncbi:MAG: transglutaminase family protein, partial [Planctomycetota bacterium]|nr:transglutaminase family protein [Planctomycetota bacterium]